MKRHRSPSPSYSSSSSIDYTPSRSSSTHSHTRKYNRLSSPCDQAEDHTSPFASTSASVSGSTSTSNLTCSLPPTCDQTPQTFENEKALEGHFGMVHRWVCQEPIALNTEGIDDETFSGLDEGMEDVGSSNGKGKEPLGKAVKSEIPLPIPIAIGGKGLGIGVDGKCGKFFPEERLLLLHYQENHSPNHLLQQGNGQKIFECFLPKDVCQKVFKGPKERRGHLIRRHHYPPRYFFSITNHGLNYLIQQYGFGVSLVRPDRKEDWFKGKEKEHGRKGGAGVDGQQGKNGGGAMGMMGKGKGRDMEKREEDDGMILVEEKKLGGNLDHRNDNATTAATATVIPASGGITHRNHTNPSTSTNNQAIPVSHTASVPDLDESMSNLLDSFAGTSLGFVPRGVRKKQKEKDQEKGKEKIGTEMDID